MTKKLDEAFRDEDSEIATLAGIVKYGGDVFVDVSDLLDANVYNDEFNAALYKSFDHHFNFHGLEAKLDIPSIMAATKAAGVSHILDQPDGKQYIRRILNYPIEKDTARREAGKLIKLRVMAALDDIAAKSRRELRTLTGNESLDTIFGVLENPLFDYITKVGSDRSDGPTQIADGVDEYLNNLEANPDRPIGISSGYPRYDAVIGGGFRRATVSMIGARPKVGKTIICDNIGLHVAGQLKIPVFNLDTEMTKDEHLARILAHLSGVSIKEIERGSYAKEIDKRKKVRDAASWLKDIPYYYDSVVDRSYEEHMAITRRWVTKTVGNTNGVTNDCLILYDYFQLLEQTDINKNIAEHQVLGFQMISMLRLASRSNIPIMSLIQLNRDGIDKDTTGVIAGSDRIARKVANFSILKKKTEEEMAEIADIKGMDGYTRKLIPIITRHGEELSDGDYINLRFDGNTAKLEEGPTRNEVMKARKAYEPKSFVIEGDELETQEEKPKRRRKKKSAESSFD